MSGGIDLPGFEQAHPALAQVLAGAAFRSKRAFCSANRCSNVLPGCERMMFDPALLRNGRERNRRSHHRWKPWESAVMAWSMYQFRVARMYIKVNKELRCRAASR
jgi:hypothetical protein